MAKIRRELKNVVYNFTEAEVKVRDATSNDPDGPTGPVLAEIAEYTYHVQAYPLVMGMLWKRLNDHGKNWRHVYKSLVVMEYLIKNGSQRVVQQCKDNLFSIETLKDFHFTDKDGKDTGDLIRKKAKDVVTLLKDETQLTDERQRANQARDRVGRGNLGALSGGNRSPRGATTPERGGTSGRFEPHINQSRPRASDEEDLQLQLALRMSKEQAEEEDKLKKQEDESLRLALELSKAESGVEGEEEGDHEEVGRLTPPSGDADLLGIGDPWSGNSGGGASEDLPPSYDLLNAPTNPSSDPWGLGPKPPSTGTSPNRLSPSDPFSSADPFASNTTTTVSGGTDFMSGPAWTSFSPTSTAAPSDPFTSLPPLTTTAPSKNPYDLSDLSAPLSTIQPIPQAAPISQEPQLNPVSVEKSFLGDNANLVNLDALVAPLPPPTSINPFGMDTSGGTTTTNNPFTVPKEKSVSLDQMKAGPMFDPLPPPLLPGSQGPPNQFNPFLS